MSLKFIRIQEFDRRYLAYIVSFLKNRTYESYGYRYHSLLNYDNKLYYY